MIDEVNCDTPAGCKRCFKCEPTKYYFMGSCQTNCPQGFFKNDVDRTCEACKAGCRTCTNTTDCSSCTPPLVAQNNECISNCLTPGTYPSVLTGSCEPCVVQNCHDCIYGLEIGTSCALCSSGYLLSFNTRLCSLTCPLYQVQRGI